MRPEPVRMGIVVPMEIELALLARGFELNGRPELRPGELVELPGGSWACLSGIGAAGATDATIRLLDLQPDLLVSFGFAGGLGASTVAGTCVLPRAVLCCDSDLGQVGECLAPAESWRKEFGVFLPGLVATGTLASSPRVLATRIDKRCLHEDTGAEAVDMESYWIISRATACCTLVVKVVLDTREFDLPDYLCIGEPDGITNGAEPGGFGVLSGLMKQPASLPALIRLGLNFRRAARRLTLVAAALKRLSAAGIP